MMHFIKVFIAAALICCSGICQAQSWSQVFGPLGEDVEGIFADGSGRVFIGTDTGVFSTTDDGINWRNDTTGLDAPDQFSFVEMRDGTLLAGTELGGIFRSSDYGLHWEAANDGLPDGSFVPVIICDAEQGIFAGATTHGIYYSSDDGSNWELRSNGLPNVSTASMTLSPNGDMYVGLTGFIAKSTDRGFDWTVCDTLQPADEVLALSADSVGDIFAGIFPGKILRSRDKGNTWDIISPAKALDPVRCLANANGKLFAGTYGGGVWQSADAGDHWSQMIDGLTGEDLMVLCCAIEGDSELFIGTLAADVFRTNISPASSVPIPDVSNQGIIFSSEQSPSGVMLHFLLPSNQQVTVTVYDVSGRNLGEFCNGFFTEGDHTVLFDSHLTNNGAYFAVMTTPSGRYVQPFVVLP